MIHKINRILLILLQTLVKSFVSNKIIDLSYNLSKYIKYKHVWKLFKVGCLHQYIIIALYCLDKNGKLLKLLRILITTMYFKDQNWISKSVYCVNYSMVCKIIFAPDSRYYGKGGQSHKMAKNTGNCKAFCVSGKRNKQFSLKILEHTVPKKESFIVLPYLGTSSFCLRTRSKKH